MKGLSTYDILCYNIQESIEINKHISVNGLTHTHKNSH